MADDYVWKYPWPPLRRFTPQQEAMYRQVHGPYWRSPQMQADEDRLYNNKPPGYWGRLLDERIKQAWRDAGLGQRGGARVPRSAGGTPLPRLSGSESAAELFLECARLAKYSARLRAMGRLWERKGITHVPWEAVEVVQRLIKDVKIRIGEPIEPDIYFPPDVVPETTADCLRFLQHPELFDTEVYRAMTHTAAWPPEGLGHPDLRAFGDKLVQLGRDRLVPLFVELAWVPRRAQIEAFVKGRTPVRPADSPHVAGRAVLIGHAVTHDWPGNTLDWLHQLAELAAAEVGVRVGYGPGKPGRFVLADDDGALDGPMTLEAAPLGELAAEVVENLERHARQLSQRSKPGEGDALLAFWSGRTDAVPWETFVNVQPMGGRSGAELPGSDGPVAYDCRRNPETGRWQTVELRPDGSQRFIDVFEGRQGRPSAAKRSQGDRRRGVPEE